MINIKVKEMAYNGSLNDYREVLASGELDGHLFSVVSYGSHPCCYVSIPAGKSINVDNISCHGGITYFGADLPGKKPDGKNWWIGWNYAHLEDYFDAGIYTVRRDGKKWTTQEMIDECINVIKQLENNEYEE